MQREKKAGVKFYKDLLKITQKTVGYAKSAAAALASCGVIDTRDMLLVMRMMKDFEELIPLAEKVIDQATRRVIHGEKVPAQEKVFSIFEPHTDIIKKDNRDDYFGHKVCLTGGPSNFISDCLIVEGNPADTDLTCQMLDRHEEVFGRYPLNVALDGGFASKNNLKSAKARGIKNVCFAKKRGLKEKDMCQSKWVYRRLRRFRAGIESGISWLKRSFGFWEKHLEVLSVFQKLRMVLRGFRKFVHPCKTRNGLTRGVHRGEL